MDTVVEHVVTAASRVKNGPSFGRQLPLYSATVLSTPVQRGSISKPSVVETILFINRKKFLSQMESEFDTFKIQRSNYSYLPNT